MRLAIYVFITQAPLVMLLMIGALASIERRREILFWAATYCDRATRGLHDRVAEELDSLPVVGR